MKTILPLLLILFLNGCGTPGHISPGIISRISLGMTKDQVIQAIGSPESVAADAACETLYYVEERPWWQWARIQVKLIDGKVKEFGESPKP